MENKDFAQIVFSVLGDFHSFYKRVNFYKISKNTTNVSGVFWLVLCF